MPRALVERCVRGVHLDCESSKGLAGCQAGLNLQNTPPRFKQLACKPGGFGSLGGCLAFGFLLWYSHRGNVRAVSGGTEALPG